MIRRIAPLVVLFMLILPLSVLAAEPGIIQGQLVNGTKGGTGKVNNIEITLTTYLNDKEMNSSTAKTDAEGRFVFSGLATGPGYSYQARLLFLEAEYTPDPISFKEGETTKSVEVMVYDTTTSDEAIQVAAEHTVIYPGPEGLQVEKYYLFTNESDRAYVGSKEVAPQKKETLRFSLPKEAVGLQYLLGLMECCVVTARGGFVDTMAVIPGGREMAYSYQIPYGAGKYLFAEDVTYPTYRYELLVRAEGVEVGNSKLASKGLRDINGVEFKHFSGSGLAVGETISVQLSGLPRKSSGAVIWVIPTLAVLAGGFGLVYWRKRRRWQPAVAESNLAPRKRKLLVELARLDDDFEAGKVPEETYRRLRAEKKAQLAGLMSSAKKSHRA